MKKRNKIKLPILNDNEKQESNNIESYDNEVGFSFGDEEYNCENIETQLKNRKKNVVKLIDIADNNSNIYDGLFQKKIPKVKIMNLSDFDDDNNDESTLMLSDQQCNRIKNQIIQKQKYSSSDFYDVKRKNVEYNEKNYVKLLNEDDKLDLMDILKNVKGNSLTDDENDKFGLSTSEFNDDKLALSSNEIKLQNAKRRIEIEEAINNLDDEWETNQLSQLNINFQKLPKMHPEHNMYYSLKQWVVDQENDDNLNNLALSQLDIARKERKKLLDRRDELINLLSTFFI